MITYSIETIYHFKCDKCNLWWSIADWKFKELITCPHCSHISEITPILG